MLLEGKNKVTPLVLTIYLDRLMYRIHNGVSDPDEMLFALKLLENKKFANNAPKCLPIITVRMIQEIKRCEKDIEVLAKCKSIAFMRDNNVSSVVDVRYRNFVGLKAIVSQLIPYVNQYEKGFDKDFPFTSINLQSQMAAFNETEPKLRESISDIKRRLDESGRVDIQDNGAEIDINKDKEEKSSWWNPLSWF
jgi:hypothetical protein